MESPKNPLKELSAIVGADWLLDGDCARARQYLHDQTETRAISGSACAVALPGTVEQVAALVRWCYQHDLPMVPRGGGTGFAGGAVPLDGALVIALERLSHPAQVEPEHWRAHVQAGAVTADVARRAREQGLYYPPDPGSAESSLIGGNIATNAGGPHTFKYGVTSTWVTGLEVVLAPGELIELGGVARKDVGGYDLRSLLIGSEGTLGIVTGAWLKLIPAPEAALPVVGFYPGVQEGCEALAAALTCGITPAAIEFLDHGALEASLGALVGAVDSLPAQAGSQTRFMLIAEVDGSPDEAARGQRELVEAMSVSGAVAVHAPSSRREVTRLWRWREGVSGAVSSQRGGKVSEDIVVPTERLAEAVGATLEIGARHQLQSCSWGHAGDGNVHATFMIDPADSGEVARAQAAGHELFELAAALGGAVSGEHGLGLVKNGAMSLQWPTRALDLHEQIKRAFDPKGLLNPGKKLVRLP